MHPNVGGAFDMVVEGHKLKLAGDNPEADPAGRVKVGGHLAENGANRLTGMIPAPGAGKWKAEVTTRFNRSSSGFPKSPRTATSAFTLTVPAP
jgi:hypothetical protein